MQAAIYRRQFPLVSVDSNAGLVSRPIGTPSFCMYTTTVLVTTFSTQTQKSIIVCTNNVITLNEHSVLTYRSIVVAASTACMLIYYNNYCTLIVSLQVQAKEAARDMEMLHPLPVSRWCQLSPYCVTTHFDQLLKLLYMWGTLTSRIGLIAWLCLCVEKIGVKIE